MSERPKMIDESDNDKIAVIQKAVDTLREHFDAVQVNTSYLDSDGATRSFSKGSGCHFSRVGLARKFIIQQEERDRIDMQHFVEEEGADDE